MLVDRGDLLKCEKKRVSGRPRALRAGEGMLESQLSLLNAFLVEGIFSAALGLFFFFQ